MKNKAKRRQQLASETNVFISFTSSFFMPRKRRFISTKTKTALWRFCFGRSGETRTRGLMVPNHA
ncbi:MAG: hypothetical protein J1G04_02665, partial [Clostridiales bacterium]|nr:hypothetical protein [Clostridiales bacterium]